MIEVYNIVLTEKVQNYKITIYKLNGKHKIEVYHELTSHNVLEQEFSKFQYCLTVKDSIIAQIEEYGYITQIDN